MTAFSSTPFYLLMPSNLSPEVMLKQAIVFNPLVVSSDSSIAAAVAWMNAAQGTCSLPERSLPEKRLPKAKTEECELATGREKNRLQMNARASCVLVMEDAQLVGILTERDIVRLSAEGHDLSSRSLAEVINRTVVTLQQSDFSDIPAALQLLQQHSIRHLPVLNDQGQVVGVLTDEILRHQLIEGLRHQVTRLEAEKVELQQNCQGDLEQQVQQRTTDLKKLAEQEQLLSAIAIQQSQVYEQAQQEIAERQQAEAALQRSEATNQVILDAVCQLNQELESRIEQRTIELRQSEARFRQIFEQSPVGIAISDLDGHLTRVNSSLTQIVRYSQAELLQRSIQDMISVDRQQQGMQKLEQLLEQTLSVITFESQLVSGQGDLIWVNVTSALIFNGFARPSAIVHLIEDVSERKQAEVERQRAELELHRTLKELSDFKYALDEAAMVAITDAKGIITYANDRFCEISQYSRKQLIGKSHQLLNSHYHPQQFFAEMWETIRSGKTWRGEIQNRGKDGSCHWLDTTIIPFLNPQNQPIQYLTIRTDITARKQTELELQELTLSLQNAMEGISRLDKRGRYVALNWAYAKLCGYEPEALVGQQWQVTIHPEDIPRMEATYETMRQRGKVEAESRGIRKDGSLFYQQITMVSALDQAGAFNGHYCFVKDISDRKAIEEALKRQLEAIEAAIDGIAILTGETYIYTYLNQAHVNLFGYQHPEELLGKCWTDLYSSEEIRRFEQEVFPVLRQQRFWQGEAIATHQNGSTFIQGLSLTLTERNELICVCRNITARKEVEEQLRCANEQLRVVNAGLARATQLKDEFLANMSHELRTPLNAILGMAEGLQEKVFGQITDRQQQAIETIERSGKHLLELINDILDLSKAESGKLELQIAPVSINHLCESSLAFVRQQAIQKNIQLSSIVPHALPHIAVDERRMRQILINLLSNAVKFTPHGGQVKLEVQVDHQPEHNFLLFSVMDTGIGIASQEMDRLFQSFVQIDSRLNRHYNGTGLGLALVRRLAELHQGSVTVASVPGQGSCFTVRLPCTCTSDAGCILAAQAEVSILPSDNAKVLIIEDSGVTADQMTRYLHELGMEAIVFPQGEGAIDAVIANQPALVILNAQLSDRSGWEVLHLLKTHAQTQHIPVLIVSVMDERSRGLALGAAEYLIKPINRDQLRSVLKQLQVSKPSSAHSIELTGTIANCNAAAHATQSVAQPATQTNHSPLILLAEDNEASIITISSYLKARGYRVLLAKNGEEAISLATTHFPHLILLDIQMPKVDGLEAIRQIRANLQAANIPIIVLTALAMPSDREKCIAAGANHYFAKPIKLKPLAETIQMLLETP